MQQMTIFDAFHQFDEAQASWQDVMGAFDFCLVKAIIPKDVLSPLENPHKLYSNEWGKINDVWGEYAFAVHRAVNSWGDACSLLKRHREEGTPCIMKLTRSKNGRDFRPEKVVEYLPVS